MDADALITKRTVELLESLQAYSQQSEMDMHSLGDSDLGRYQKQRIAFEEWCCRRIASIQVIYERNTQTMEAQNETMDSIIKALRTINKTCDDLFQIVKSQQNRILVLEEKK